MNAEKRRSALIRVQPRLKLKLILQGKLHLPRRSGITRWKTRVGDNAKRSATNLRGPSRLPEVRVIEHVKNFPPEFDHLPFTQLRPFDQRQV
jgi:hypothetical protein